ncbi:MULTISPECIES: DUF2505 domain-containing protein [Arthrobacter]|uniref:DUF2505 domain-containing protein n=2 Tax=Arthrobacter TaxID=1663 RepID=A0ABU9KK78_9MICC|nr:DUF2505 domain-containing protein [Arthrobacter sp. YJM1]MDP5227305.1 DUF2505 domain-containing protein [Arthrobacter sp. YJM1]
MALNASTTVPFSLPEVAAVLVNEDFVRHVSELVGGSLEEFTVDGDTSAAFTATVVRTVPTTRLPDIARKVVGETLTVTQREAWTAPETDGSRQADIQVSIAGAPVSAKAVQKLVSVDGQTRIDVEGEVTSSIPFLGGKIAGAAEPMVGKALNLQAQQVQSWLESH